MVTAARVLRRYQADRMPGGLGDKKSPKDFDPEALAEGIKIEREHTDDPAVAREIAMDHLTEDKDYYRCLAQMEKDASTRQAFKVSPDIVDAGRRAREAAKEIEDRSSTLSQLMQSIVGSLRWELHRAKRKGGDVRNLTAVLKELEDYDKDIQRACAVIRNLGISTTMGAAMGDLTLEMPDTPSLQVLK